MKYYWSTIIFAQICLILHAIAGFYAQHNHNVHNIFQTHIFDNSHRFYTLMKERHYADAIWSSGENRTCTTYWLQVDLDHARLEMCFLFLHSLRIFYHPQLLCVEFDGLREQHYSRAFRTQQRQYQALTGLRRQECE
jgi:hypothetical protein